MNIDTASIVSGAILALCGFVTAGIVSLKVSVGKISEHLKIQEEHTKDFRVRMNDEIKDLNMEVKLIWKEVQGGKYVDGR